MGKESQLRPGKVLSCNTPKEVQLGTAAAKSGRNRVHNGMKLVETKDGTIVEVFVKPNQPKFKITLEGEEVIVLSTQEPVKNKVNKEIIKELSKLFHSQV